MPIRALPSTLFCKIDFLALCRSAQKEPTRQCQVLALYEYPLYQLFLRRADQRPLVFCQDLSLFHARLPGLVVSHGNAMGFSPKIRPRRSSQSHLAGHRPQTLMLIPNLRQFSLVLARSSGTDHLVLQ